MEPHATPHRPFGNRISHRVLVHRGEHVRLWTLPSWAVPAICAFGAFLLVWAAGATGFIVFRDQFVAVMIARQTAMQYDYEDRITALRTQVDRLKSQKIVDQAMLDDKVARLTRRQASLESRQSVVQSLGGIATAIGLRAPQEFSEAPAQPAVESPPSEALILPGKQASMFGYTTREKTPDASEALARKLDQMAGNLGAIEAAQAEALASIEKTARARASQVRDALADIGLDADRIAAKSVKPEAEGGPLIPLDPPSHQDAFEALSYRVQGALSEADRLSQALTVVPLRRPFPTAEITSGFGVRSDPFLGTAAMHAGIDFREDQGAPVRVTASGVVTEAGWSGGYGNMVEVNHGNGLSTRYGHLSDITVAVGQRVAIGDTVGKVGTTGRSTGPHLHYETRINGEAVDPIRFLKAGKQISG